MTAYAELAATTNFSFLRGASHPQEMVATAKALGLAAIGIADRNSFAGVVRAFDEAQEEPTDQASRRHPPRDARRFRNPRLSHRSGGLWPALPASDEGQSRGEERRVPHRLRGRARRERGPDAHRLAAGRAGFASRFHRAARAPGAPGAGPRLSRGRPSPSRRRAAPSRPFGRARREARHAARRRQRRSLPRARAPAASRHPHLRPREMHDSQRRAFASRSMPSAISSRPRRWRGSSPGSRRRSHEACASPRPAASRSTSSNMNIRTSPCRRARRQGSILRI